MKKLPLLTGTIKRRLLINFRVDAAVMRRCLPPPFQPKLHDGFAIAGVCLIRLEGIRPAGWPALLGISSENAAHRIAVEWTDGAGARQEGVYIPRRDTGSWLNHFAGGRIFPGEHHLADFDVQDDGIKVQLAMGSRDQTQSLRVQGSHSDTLPSSSCFTCLEDSSRFFEGGSVGYSVTAHAGRLDGLQLMTREWRVKPFAVDEVHSSFFSDESRFPAGAVQFDHALIMRDVPHEWRAAADMLAS